VGEWFRGAGGLRLRAAFWTPSALVAKKPRGTVVLSPGRTEPIEKYYEVIGNFLARGWCVLAHDWRGQGLSARLLPDRLKGHARAVEEFLDDYARLMEAWEARAPKPWIMVGHSMGGVLNLMTLEGGETRFSGALLSSPMLRIRTGKRSMWSVKLAVRWNLRHGKAGDYVLDDADDPFDHTFQKDALTSDESRYEQWRQQLYACPHLAVGGVTWGWLAVGLDAGERALKPKALKAVQVPVAIVQAGEDDRVWKQTSKWAARRLGRGRYVEVPGSKHEVIMETDELRAVFLEEFDAMAAYVSPVEDLSPLPVSEPVAEPIPEPTEAA
jgi:lysophospholipase